MQLGSGNRSGEKREGQGKRKDRNKYVEHTLLCILCANLHDLFGVLDGGAQTGFVVKIDILLDILDCSVSASGDSLGGCTCEPVNNGSATEEAEQRVRIKQVQDHLRLNSEGLTEQKDQGENHGRGPHDGRTDQNRLGGCLEGVSGRLSFSSR